MEYQVTNNFSNEGTRNEVRMRVVDKLSEEPAGQGRDDLASRFTYFVEQLSSGDRVYLRRPANLHNGFDFIVCVENVNFNQGGRFRNYPKHEDIVEDLKQKKNESRDTYNLLFNIIKKIYECHDVSDEEINVNFETGYPCDLIIKCLKWLFIEQDIRYWNYSGRDMLWDGIASL